MENSIGARTKESSSQVHQANKIISVIRVYPACREHGRTEQGRREIRGYESLNLKVSLSSL